MSAAQLLSTGIHYAPAAILDDLGIVVIRTWLRDTWGAWCRDRQRIVIASGLSEVQERCVLAHELEHALADDAECSTPLARIRQERRADLEASRKLVAISDLAEVAQWAGDPHTAAAELRVTERLLEVRLNDLAGEGWPWRPQDGSRTAG
ncbi:ImmA/IrrE family metallo-endopeptidase [Streptomyces tauricus]|uniref:ImmA/IrrE family metallo-endopeptidase n=1 Tax=Streptomyces tauricus TaxID=68274 RepID=UPI001674891F|nr:ImmA/IrrE family metallo-endopeptidase [Streptomyces tauricus]